ncbi:hypothetical protein Val02_07740 [Virgisporangium aliadipatigenens]|uniref:Uncharacterized protein n=1 Tax=Virgisporangium aliadipatigenens TaxID=741659 RepID=A0A8J4DNS4_9ACTN|nr:hypothetical protein [Virgisporangium aliadipatigenens]GIJ43888.1 hypothetical protein Val02_07740 [Virgisporangium aliadipatigenens]
MSVSSISGNALGLVAAAGRTPDPAARQAQVNAQADLLQAIRQVDLPTKVVNLINDKKGIDLYL